jgi:hypothetical protein
VFLARDFVKTRNKMVPLKCNLFCYSAATHLSQIYTGFGELARRGVVQASLTRMPGYSGKSDGVPAWLRVRLNESLDIAYDVSDSHVIPETIDLEQVDYCFKRSFRPDYVETLRNGHKVFPLGLNYPAFASCDSGLRRAVWATSVKDCVKQVIKSTPWLARLFRVQGSIYTSPLSRFEGYPNASCEPTVLFIVDLWDPTKARSAEKRDERWEMAHRRAECIRQLRNEFGARFVGGCFVTEFATKHFKDCLLPHNMSSRKDCYLKMLDSASVCVATTGLHGSVGWKVGEYVAGAKAIVSEPLKCRLPGDFAAGKNYLPFVRPDQCVQAAAELVDDGRKRYEMMRENFLYYWNWLRPDALILTTLLTALCEAARQPPKAAVVGDLAFACDGLS